MHEYPITEQIIKIAGKHCRESGGSKVTKVNLVIGDYSGYVGESVQMYFDIISEGTVCDGALVEIEHIAPKLRCPDCGELFKHALGRVVIGDFDFSFQQYIARVHSLIHQHSCNPGYGVAV